MRLYKHAKTRQQAIMEKASFAADSDMEVCVICGKVTDVLKTDPLENRLGYLPGAGQLCKDCAIDNIHEENVAMRNGFAYSLPVYEKDSM